MKFTLPTKEPKVTLELLEYLDSIYPNQLPNQGMTMERIHIKIGQVMVVTKLHSLYEEQQVNILG